MVYQGPSVEPTLPPAVAGPAFLLDGTEVWVRPLQASDEGLVREFVEQEPTESPGPRRPFTIRAILDHEKLAPSPPGERLCLLVLGELADRVALLGIGEYARSRPGAPSAEVAFLVPRSLRGRGIATLLLVRLARAAQAFGISRFEARGPAESSEMLEVFRGSGGTFHDEGGEREGDFQIRLGPETGTSGPVGGGSADPAAASGLGSAPSSPSGHPRPSALRSRG